MLNVIGNLLGGLIKTVLVFALIALILIIVGVIVISRMTVLDMIQLRMSMELVPMKIAEFVNVMGL